MLLKRLGGKIYSIRIPEGVAIDQIVAWAQFTISEPLHIAMSEGARLDGCERFVPGDEFFGKMPPEFVRILDGLLVHLLVFL